MFSLECSVNEYIERRNFHDRQDGKSDKGNSTQDAAETTPVGKPLIICSDRKLSFFITGICMILERVKVPGVSTVTNGYSTVLLQEGTSAYVVTAIIAFCFGVGVTVLCIRYRNRQEHPENHSDKRTETLLK